MQTDVVIVGTGLAGMITALETAKSHDVVLITKTRLLESNSRYAQGGIAAVRDKKDSFVKHINDTFAAGDWHNKPNAVRALVKEAPEALGYLESLGITFDETLAKEGGHSMRRISHVKDETGKAVVTLLAKKIRAHKCITVLEFSQVISLLRHSKNDVITGVMIEQTKTGKRQSITAASTVLASGGVGALFSYTTNPAIATGDGIALAMQAGAKVKDIEFIQFHPTTLNVPGKPHFLLSEALRGEGAVLVNASGKRFMKRYHPLGDLAPRDIVSRAVYTEMQKQPIYLDARPIGKATLQVHFPGISKHVARYGLRIATQLLPIAPTAHYLCGGIITNLVGQTSVPGLFAVGEVAYTGSQGANRLASNSLLECIVYAKRLSAHLQKELPSTTARSKAPMLTKATNPSVGLPLIGAHDAVTKNDIQGIMWDQVGIIRNKTGLSIAVQSLRDIQKQATSITQLFMATTALAIATAALKRKKSLGAHYRES